jgi:5-methylcytosine-specific restriction endonuclease McrA
LKITKRLTALRKAGHENTVRIIEALVIRDRGEADAEKPREKVTCVAVKHEDPLFAENPEPTESRVSVRTTLTEDRYEEFEKARARISRKIPGATVEDVLNELVDHYLKARAPRKMKRPKRSTPRTASSPKARSRHIPKAVRDQVVLRDNEQCTRTGADGHRCTAKHNLHIDHIVPWASGGTHDPENLRVLCAANNQHEARRAFGPRRIPKLSPESNAPGSRVPRTPSPPGRA